MQIIADQLSIWSTFAMNIHIHETRERFLNYIAEDLANYAAALPTGTCTSTSRLLGEVASTCEDAALLINAVEKGQSLTFEDDASLDEAFYLLSEMHDEFIEVLQKHDCLADFSSTERKELEPSFDEPFLLRRRVHAHELRTLTEPPTIERIQFEESCFFAGDASIDAAITDNEILAQIRSFRPGLGEGPMDVHVELSRAKWNSLEAALFELGRR